jgi:hypothetical protein
MNASGKNRISQYFLPLAIVIYTLWNSRELFQVWLFAAMDWMGWLPFLIWLSPLWVIARNAHPLFLWIALMSSILGNAASFNALKYLGLASAIAAFAPMSAGTVAWWLCSLSWMPAFGWLGTRYFPEHLLLVRFTLACLSVLILLTNGRSRFRNGRV